MAIWNWWSHKSRTSPQPLAEQGQGIERRAAPRHFSTRVTSCSMIKLPANVSVPTELRDISRMGIGLVCHKAVEPGTFLVINLAGPQKFSATLQARVVHSTQQSKDTWAVGCLLRQELTEEELKAIL